MRKHLITLVLAILPILGFSQHRSENDAIAIAQEFWGNKVNRAKLKAVPQNSIAKAKARVKAKSATSESKQSFYVINDEENNRFVIVSSDNRLYKILGYSENGVFNSDSIPLGLADILLGYDNQYNYLLNHDDHSSKEAKAMTSTGSPVKPLISTKWGQEAPYNQECPTLILPSATGCVATAMAQVMNYHKYPSNGQGHTSYTSSSFNFEQDMSFSSCNFDWANMANVYEENSSEAQKSAVANLMHACGVSVHMDYTFVGSSAYSIDMAYALHKYFGYNKNLKYYERKYFSSEEWNAIIQNDLSEGLPILYGGIGESVNEKGETTRDGHLFILDGYDGESKYHFNWGWEGKYDGYYELTSLAPKEDSDFTLDQAMVCNISTSTKGIYEDIFFATALLIGNSTVNVGKFTTATFDPICYSTNTNSYDSYFNGTFGIGVFDLNHKFIKSLYDEDGKGLFKAGTQYSDPISTSLYFDRTTFKDGSKYYIAPYAKSNNATEHTWIRTVYGLWDYYLAEVENGEVKLTLKGKPIDPVPMKTGILYASAFNKNNEKVRWKISLTKDEKESNKYWLDNIDPSITEKDNKVYGLSNETGTILTIPQGQILGSNLTLTNYSDNTDISCYISNEDGTLTIPAAWGCMSTPSEVSSRYTQTELSFSLVKLENPTIIVNDGMMQILCPTKDAKIYYTLDGKTPTENSTCYISPICIDGNCTIKAIAVLDKDNISEVIEYKVTSFIVANPIVSTTSEMVSISCKTEGAKIYYTTDGTIPREEAEYLYGGSFPYEHSFVLKAFAVKEGYTKSEMIEQSVIYVVPGRKFFVQNNIAGQLSTRVSYDDISNVSCLEISGEMNGTDFKHLYSLLEAGNITDLNLADARIVRGGDPYATPKYLAPYYTEDNVIGTDMFEGLTTLVSLTLPKSATKFKMFAINNCNNIGELALPDECVELSMDAIYSCKNLHTLSIGSKLRTFNSNAINGCNKLSAFVVNDANNTFKSIEGILFSKDGSNVVKYPCGLQNAAYVVPENVTCIGNNAFEYCQFESVTLPNALQIIGSSSFSQCKKLTEIIIPNSVQRLGSFSFYGCSNIKKVELSDDIQEIPDYSFNNCIALREFVIGKNVNSISDNAFEGCSSLQKYAVNSENKWYSCIDGILFSKNMHTLLSCPPAFYSQRYNVPAGVSQIANNGFSNCSNIEKVILPESVTRIGSSAFSGCKNMVSIVMPKTLDEIGHMAFYNCSKLESLIIPDGVCIVPMSMAYKCVKLSFVSLPNSITDIKDSAFEGCTSLKNIQCEVENASMITVEPSILDGSYDSFKNMPFDCTWYVPEGSESAYKAQPWWVSTWNLTVDIESVANDSDMKVIPGEHSVEISSPSNNTVNIYNIQGQLVKTATIKAGQSTSVVLPNGIYIINGVKYSIK